jgi:hypothetical protein
MKLIARRLNNEYKWVAPLEEDIQVFTKDKTYNFVTVEHSYVDTYTKKPETVTFYRTINDKEEEQTMSFTSFIENFIETKMVSK